MNISSSVDNVILVALTFSHCMHLLLYSLLIFCKSDVTFVHLQVKPCLNNNLVMLNSSLEYTRFMMLAMFLFPLLWSFTKYY